MPEQLEMERGVIRQVVEGKTQGGFTRSNALGLALASLSTTDFADSTNRKIFAAIQRAASNTPEPETSIADVESLLDSEYLKASLYEIATAGPAEFTQTGFDRLLLGLNDATLSRQLLNMLEEMKPRAQEAPRETLNEILDRIFEYLRDSHNSQAQHISNFIEDAEAEVDRRGERGGMLGYRSGIPAIDNNFQGIQPRLLHVLGARPKMGKSLVGMQICGTLSDPAFDEGAVRVLAVSPEMSAVQYMMRLATARSGVSWTRFKEGTLWPDEQDRLKEALRYLEQCDLIIDESGTPTISSIRQAVIRWKPQVLFVDYLQLVQPDEPTHNEYKDITVVSKAINAMKKDFNLAIIVAAQLNRNVDSEDRKDKRPVMSDLRGCVTGDTLATLSDGSRVPVRNLVGSTPSLVSLDESGKLIERNSDMVWSTGVKPVFKMELSSGKEVKATADHRFLTFHGWKKLEEISTQDRIAAPRFLPEPSNPERMSEERLGLLAHLIGDGSYLTHQPLRYTTGSEECSEFVRRASISEFGSTVSRHESNGNYHQLVFSGNGNRWHKLGMGAWLREMEIWDQRSKEKRVPAAVFRLSNKQIAFFLRHLYATDGTIGEHGRGAVIYLDTASQGLAWDVQSLLLRIGLLSVVKTVFSTGSTWYKVKVSGAAEAKRFCEEVGGFGDRAPQVEALLPKLDGIKSNPNLDTIPREIWTEVKRIMKSEGVSWREMASRMGLKHTTIIRGAYSPSRSTLRKAAEALGSQALLEMASNDLIWEKVISITPAGEEETYDLTVPGSENWLAYNVVSHNSGQIEQDADRIIFLYRDARYFEESNDREEAVDPESIDFICGKDRHGEEWACRQWIAHDKLWVLGKDAYTTEKARQYASRV